MFSMPTRAIAMPNLNASNAPMAATAIAGSADRRIASQGCAPQSETNKQ